MSLLSLKIRHLGSTSLFSFDTLKKTPPHWENLCPGSSLLSHPVRSPRTAHRFSLRWFGPFLHECQLLNIKYLWCKLINNKNQIKSSNTMLTLVVSCRSIAILGGKRGELIFANLRTGCVVGHASVEGVVTRIQVCKDDSLIDSPPVFLLVLYLNPSLFRPTWLFDKYGGVWLWKY